MFWNAFGAKGFYMVYGFSMDVNRICWGRTISGFIATMLTVALILESNAVFVRNPSFPNIIKVP